MSMTMLQLIQAATREMGLPVPASVAGNTAIDVAQMLGLLNKVGRELYTNYDWQALDVEYRFYTQYLQTTGDIANNSAVITTTGKDITYTTAASKACPIPPECFGASWLKLESVTDQATTDTVVTATFKG